MPLYPEIVEGDNEGDSQEEGADEDADLMLDLGFGAPPEEGMCCCTFTKPCLISTSAIYLLSESPLL